MSDDGVLEAVVVLGVVLALVVGLVLLIDAATPSQSDIEAAIRSGRVVVGMTGRQVLSVWGEPDSLETKMTKQPLGIGEAVFSGLFLSRLEQAVTYYTYTIWIYKKPWRTVTFSSAGRVVEVSP